MKVYIEPRDIWVGYHRGDHHHYICPLPMLVFRWRRANDLLLRDTGHIAKTDRMGGGGS